MQVVKHVVAGGLMLGGGFLARRALRRPRSAHPRRLALLGVGFTAGYVGVLIAHQT